jgi:hypothetical protein
MRLRGAQEGPATMGDLLAAPRRIFALWRGFHARGAVLALLGLTSSAPATDNHVQHPTAQCNALDPPLLFNFAPIAAGCRKVLCIETLKASQIYASG